LSVLLIVSAEEAAGKTAICAGLAVNYLNEGKAVGFLKPQAPDADKDIKFMKRVLNGKDISNPKNKDIVLAEGTLGWGAGDTATQAVYQVARDIKARVIAVEAYGEKDPGLIEVYKGFGESFLGVITNKVPVSRLKRTHDEVGRRLKGTGIRLLGVIPENRVLLAVTVGELAESLKGKILNNTDKADELVQNFMLGAMVVDSGADYFGRKSNKAAIIKQERPDMQLAALETSTACLVLAGSDKPPVYNVLHKAESRSVPVISTNATVNDIVATIEKMLQENRLQQSGKLVKLGELVKQNVDTKALL
jgi:BioD-like phosphotransacetylase family protein